jgi:hypothetical protein
MHGVGIAASDSQSHLHSHHNLDSVAEMVATANSTTVSNVFKMIDTGWPERADYRNESAMVRLEQRSADRVLTFSCHCLFSIDPLDMADAPLIPEAYISLAYNASSHFPTASRGIPSLSTTPSRSKSHPWVQPSPCVHRAHSTLLRCSKPSQPWLGFELYARC